MGRYFDMGIAYEDHWHVDVDGDEAPLDIWACKRVENPPTMRFCVYHEGRRVDFDSTAWAAIPVISRRMADCLESLTPCDVQRFPALVKGEPDGQWEVLNVVARPDCIDHERSKITYYPANHPEHPGKPRGVLRLIIDSDRAEGHEIFRPKGWEIALIVSERVKNALEELDVTGIEFNCVTE